jgi:uncharacterized BrkB/YihY/UPF0761 family membrane protein
MLGCGSATTKQPCLMASIVLLGLLYSLVAGINTISALANSSNMSFHDHCIEPSILETIRTFLSVGSHLMIELMLLPCPYHNNASPLQCGDFNGYS